MGTPSVYPPNWKTGGKELMEMPWRIQYYFRDERYREKYPKGKLIVIKGMNEYKTLTERKAATKALIDDAISMHQDMGYNPITGQYTKAQAHEPDYVIHPKTPVIDAFKKALEISDYERATKTDMRNCFE